MCSIKASFVRRNEFATVRAGDHVAVRSSFETRGWHAPQGERVSAI